MRSQNLKKSEQKQMKKEVYNSVSRIPRGKVSTYKEIAKAVGLPKNSRWVGFLMKNNKDPENVPCYKIVKSDGSLGGYFGSGKKGLKKKIELLEKDGIRLVNGKIDLKNYLYGIRGSAPYDPRG
jgi:deoxyribonuclease V